MRTILSDGPTLSYRMVTPRASCTYAAAAAATAYVRPDAAPYPSSAKSVQRFVTFCVPAAAFNWGERGDDHMSELAIIIHPPGTKDRFHVVSADIRLPRLGLSHSGRSGSLGVGL
jgi:hypothetical protein